MFILGFVPGILSLPGGSGTNKNPVWLVSKDFPTEFKDLCWLPSNFASYMARRLNNYVNTQLKRLQTKCGTRGPTRLGQPPPFLDSGADLKHCPRLFVLCVPEVLTIDEDFT